MNDTLLPSEILGALKKKLSEFAPDPADEETGRVAISGDGIVQAWGLDGVMAGELVDVETSSGAFARGMAMNLEEDTVGIILFEGAELVKEGDLVRRTGKVAEVPVGDALSGRVLDPFGKPLDGSGPLPACPSRPVDAKGPGIVERQNVGIPLQTGIKSIDSMIPIGRGQRELIIGDRRTGKTAIAIDAIINQGAAPARERVRCFYVAIGQKRSSVARLVETLRERGAMEYTTIVSACASDPAAMQYIAPYAATAMAEHYRDSGGHALVVFDDLTKHAQAYRELSLLMRRSPGREAYPGDVFYIHSRLLERAAMMSAELGGGSLTALPVVETLEGDVSAYIPTNVISITDGQIFLESQLFNSGIRPAINAGISVSRVGGDAQVKAMKQVAGSLRIDLAQFRELAAFMQFSSDLDAATKRQLARGERLTEILKQPQFRPIEIFKQVMILRAGVTGRLDALPTAKLLAYQDGLFSWLDDRASAFMEKLRAAKKLDDELSAEADRVLDEYSAAFRPDAAESGPDSGYSLNMALALTRGSAPINRETLNLVEHLTARELSSPSLEGEIEDIMAGRDVQERGRLQELLGSCRIMDFDESEKAGDAFMEAAAALEGNLGGLKKKKIRSMFLEREKESSTAVQAFFAIPHVIVEGKDVFQLIAMRSRRGVIFHKDLPKVHTVFFLAGSLDQRHFHLVVISALARLVREEGFQREWMEAEGPDALREILKRGRPSGAA